MHIFKNGSLRGNPRDILSKLFSLIPRLRPVGLAKESCPLEEPDFYTRGGFHRVLLGDTFDSSRYAVVRKLGYGQYSTVWLARDSRAQKYVALKILRADCYGGTREIFEREILSTISSVSANSEHQGRHYVSTSLDHFTHSGPDGDHVCFVFDVLGHHLNFQAAKHHGGKLPVRAVRKITQQLLLGLDFLHRECGIIHTDLKPTNILLELENPDAAITEYLSEVTPRKSNAGLPLQEVVGTPLVSEMTAPHIRVIDFSVASRTDKHLSDLIQSPALRAPEVMIGAPWGTAVDIWSLGCLVIEFIQGIVPFSGEASERGTWTANDDRLARIIEILGPFPTQLLMMGNRTADFFDKKGNLIRIPNMTSSGLERLIDGESEPFLRPRDMSNAEVAVFIDFLRRMLKIDPQYRSTAAELLRHEWLQSDE